MNREDSDGAYNALIGRAVFPIPWKKWPNLLALPKLQSSLGGAWRSFLRDSCFNESGDVDRAEI